jgi:hypothetical protein
MTASVRYSRVASASAAPVTDYRTAKVDGVNVFYREAGPADAPVVLLLHGVHRIIGRSTTYGAPYDPNALSEEDDDVPRGVYFLFISAKAMATLEFLQQEWINDGDFTALGEERNPVVGLQPDDALFSIPREPVRRHGPGQGSDGTLTCSIAILMTTGRASGGIPATRSCHSSSNSSTVGSPIVAAIPWSGRGCGNTRSCPSSCGHPWTCRPSSASAATRPEPADRAAFGVHRRRVAAAVSIRR